MRATDILMAEHRVIERVLAVLAAAATRLEQGEAVRAGFFVDAADFAKGFADGCHHRKEEEVLFKAMVASGMSGDSGPISLMLAEHSLVRAYARALREAALKMEAGDALARAAVVFDARSYAELLRQHIAKEDSVLFPLASRAIPAAEHDRVAEAFERVEHEATGVGGREQYLALVKKLEKEMAVNP